jgi:hypothetical protein
LKTYKSKSGKEFRISKFPKEKEGEIVYFTEDEFMWLKSNNVSPEEFNFIHNAKLLDFRFEIITKQEEEKKISNAKMLADKYATPIIERLKHGIEEEKEPRVKK